MRHRFRKRCRFLHDTACVMKLSGLRRIRAGRGLEGGVAASALLKAEAR
jgi:hypothetical protein